MVVAGDLTDDGYPDQYPEAREELAAIECPEIVLVPGNHDARNVGYIRFEEEFGSRDSRMRAELGGSMSRSSPSTPPSPTSTRGRSGASTTGGSPRVSTAPPTCACSSATTI